MQLRFPNALSSASNRLDPIANLPVPLYSGSVLNADHYEALVDDLNGNPSGRTWTHRLFRPTVSTDAVAAAWMTLREDGVIRHSASGQHSYSRTFEGADRIVQYLDDARINARWIAGDWTGSPDVLSGLWRKLTAGARFFLDLAESAAQTLGQNDVWPLREFVWNAVKGSSDDLAAFLPSSSQLNSQAQVQGTRILTIPISRALAKALSGNVDQESLPSLQRSVARNSPHVFVNSPHVFKDILWAFLTNSIFNPSLGEASLEHYLNVPAGEAPLERMSLQVVLRVSHPDYVKK